MVKKGKGNGKSAKDMEDEKKAHLQQVEQEMREGFTLGAVGVKKARAEATAPADAQQHRG